MHEKNKIIRIGKVFKESSNFFHYFNNNYKNLLFTGSRYNSEQQLVIEWAKNAQRVGGMDPENAIVLVELAEEAGLPARGPEFHLSRFQEKNSARNVFTHVHVGPVNHIPVNKTNTGKKDSNFDRHM